MAADQNKPGDKLNPDDRARLNRIGGLSQSILLAAAIDRPGEQVHPGEFLSALAMVTAHIITEYYSSEPQQKALDYHVALVQSLVRDNKTLEKS